MEKQAKKVNSKASRGIAPITKQTGKGSKMSIRIDDRRPLFSRGGKVGPFFGWMVVSDIIIELKKDKKRVVINSKNGQPITLERLSKFYIIEDSPTTAKEEKKSEVLGLDPVTTKDNVKKKETKK